MNDKNPFLKVEDLVVEYTSEQKVIHAVNQVSFSLERGKTLALVGETGAGKTTIAKAILRILPDHGAKIAGGKVELEGTDLISLKETDMLNVRGRKISMVFQDPMTALNPIMRIGNQVAEVIKEHNNISKEEAKKRAVEMLKMVGIQPERYYNYPHEFSGGMKQRVIIAMALACQPELLLADEPTTALDVTIQAQVMAMIRQLRDQYNTALVLITHDLGVVAEIADDVAVVYAGEIIEYGSKRSIYKNPKHPYTIALFEAIPNLEKDVDRLKNIKGLPPDPAELPEGCYFSPRCPYADEKCRKEHPQLESVDGKHICRCAHWKNASKMRNDSKGE